MSNLYNLTQQINKVIQEKAQKHGLEIEIGSNFLLLNDGELQHEYQYKHFNNHNGQIVRPLCVLAIEAPQIRQILIVLEDVLNQFPKPYWVNSENLCQKWLDGLHPLFDREPETVLAELLNILKSL